MTKPDLMAELAEAWIVDLAPGVERPDEYSPVIVDNLRAAEYWAKQKDWIVTPLVRADRAVDSERIDYLQRAVDVGGAILLHNGEGRGSGFVGLGLKNTGRTLRQAIDQCLEADQAMHNSAREG